MATPLGRSHLCPVSASCRLTQESCTYPKQGDRWRGDLEVAPGGLPCKKLLDAIHKRWCEWLPELESLCAHAIDRLEFLRKEVASREPHDPLRAQYVKALTFLAKITQRRPLLGRLAKCDTIAQFIRHLQQDIDLVAEGLGLGDCEEVTKWRVEWEGDRAKQLRLLAELVASSTDRELVSGDGQGARKLEEILADYEDDLKGDDLPQDQLELKKATYERVLKYSRIADVTIADWFISANDLVLDDGPTVDGSFGRVTRAIWFHDGVRKPVVVKQIFPDIVEVVRRPLIVHLEAWYRLPDHPNVLQLYGGNFVGSQYFFVCEDACQGNLRDFVREHGPNWKLLWDVFIQVTEGLVFLHQRGIVHGGLSCNNVLLGERNIPKLGDFGLNSIRTVSMSLSSYHVQSEDSRWQAPEMYEDTSTPQFAADTYALGMCMIEVLQQDTPVPNQTDINQEIRDLRPAHVNDETWEFIERLCAANCHERPNLNEVQERMRALRSQITDFPVAGLREASSLEVLSALDTRLLRMPENEGLCRQVLSRLQFLHDFVAPLEAKDSLKIEYETVIARFTKIIRRKPLLSRLADSEKLVVKIQEMQLKLSDVAQGLGLADKPEMTHWRLQWDFDRADQHAKLFELVTGASEGMLVSEFQSDKKVQEALMILNNGMKWKDQSPKMLELKQATLSRVRGFLGQTGFCMYDWFIPFDDLECGDTVIRDQDEEIVKGTWLHDGERKKVMVHRLHPHLEYSEDELIRNLDLWCNMPENEHILKVYGGSHIGRPFYVCEYAPVFLWEYLEDEEHMTQFWQLFLQAAQGLKVLHDRQIIHRNLRCNNILVGENHAAKLADTGKRSEEDRLRASGYTTVPLTFGSVRWQPREIMYNDEIRFESDIYALGMCMIEIIIREPPFGVMVEDEEVVEKILSGESYPRPDEVSDRAWDLISRLCDPDFEKRPALDDVIEEIRELVLNNVDPRRNPNDSVPPSAAREISYTPPTPSEHKTSTTATCSSCSEASCAFEQWCQCCGNYVCAGNTDVDSQSFANFVKRHTRTEVLQKLFEISVFLQELHTNNIVYGDLKPSNIRIGRDGKAQFTDFKYCLELLGSAPCSSRDRSVRWQAPECLRGQRPTLASDIYTFGMCFIYAVSGQPPWGKSLADEDIQYKVCDQRRMPPGFYKLRKDDLKLVDKMCEYEPRMRPTIADVVRHLANSVEDDGDRHPEWVMMRDLPKDSGVVPISTTALVSRHLGWWKDARVCVEKPTGAFKCTSRSFRAVADLWFSLSHPSILPLYRAYEQDGKQGFICEYAEGGVLNSYLHNNNPETTHVWEIVLDAALGLLYMHNMNIAHGDIGARNILVGSGARGKLSGFYLSSRIDNHIKDLSPEEDPTTEGVSTSTMCPVGHPTSFESDVYGLGVCIIKALGTQTQFTLEECPPAPACAVCAPKRQLLRPEALNDEEWQLIQDMCCDEPARRIVMEQVVDRLKWFVAVRVAIGKHLPTLSGIRLNLDQQKQLQVMMATNMRENEPKRSSSDRDATSDNYGASDDSDFFSNNGSLGDSLSTGSSSVDYTSAIQPRQVSFQNPPIEFLAENAARELITEELLPRLRRYTSAQVPTVDHAPSARVLPMQLRAKWGIHHEDLERIVDGQISAGSFGSVARGLWFGAPVALKRLHKFDLDQCQALLVETNLWYGLRHPHIARLFGACTGGYQLLVSELVGGGRLDKYLTTGLGVEATWGLLQDAAIGLQGLHLHGVVHADLKCDNILVSGDGRAKLIDFGLSCLHTVDGGKCQGAERWKAPECLKGKGPTFASDVFSFGMCIVQAVSGKLPWGLTMPNSVVRYHVVRAQLPTKPDALTPVQWELVKRMCRFEPDDRLDLDFVVKVLGYFAKRAPYVDDRTAQEILATWESESQAATP